VIARALQALKQQAQAPRDETYGQSSVLQQQAVQEMLAFVEKNHVRLSGMSVKDLIHEGHHL
jgi:hypothetical protein